MPGAWVAAVICDCVRARAIGHTGRPCSQQWDAVFVCSLPHPPPSSSVACFPDIAFPPDPSPAPPSAPSDPSLLLPPHNKGDPPLCPGRPRVACGQCRDGTDGTAEGQPFPPCITGNPLLRPGPVGVVTYWIFFVPAVDTGERYGQNKWIEKLFETVWASKAVLTTPLLVALTQLTLLLLATVPFTCGHA